VTVLFYGGMWWGLLPLIPHVSYEGHISGTIAGIVSALIDRKFYINLLPKRKIPQWFQLENEEKNPYDSI
jgi:membrane associated rhomboid family serine protease